MSCSLGDNEIVVDVGGCCFGYPGLGASEPEKSLIFDHHFSRPNNYPSASAAVLHHAADIVKLLAAHDDIWIVTHQEPDFDALCAVYLVKALLGGTTGEADDEALREPIRRSSLRMVLLARGGPKCLETMAALDERSIGSIPTCALRFRVAGPFSWRPTRRVWIPANDCMPTVAAGFIRCSTPGYLAPAVRPRGWDGSALF